MEQEELKYWLWWNRTPGIGSNRFFRLLENFGSMKEAWLAPTEQVLAVIGEKAFRGYQQVKKEWDPELELKKLQHAQFRIYCYLDPGFPHLLKKISDPPPLLYVWGNFEYGDDAAIAIIGTRTPTPAGVFHAQELAGQLSRQGLTIVSGMARGIDSAAHRGTLAVGGRTFAVLGSGLDVPYPIENTRLMEEIAENGAVISEFPLGTEPFAKNFPARNRIISGLSLGIVVVEAAHDSGSLITAGMAAEQGRDIFAVPGNVSNEGSKGPHQLIKQGAKLVEDYRDILVELALPELAAVEIETAQTALLNEAETQILSFVSREPVHIDQIVRRSQLPSAQVTAVLVQLELKGIVKRFPGQLYIRIK